jgi:hypothetical protein
MSSRPPGCSPTSISPESTAPLPKTVSCPRPSVAPAAACRALAEPPERSPPSSEDERVAQSVALVCGLKARPGLVDVSDGLRQLGPQPPIAREPSRYRNQSRFAGAYAELPEKLRPAAESKSRRSVLSLKLAPPRTQSSHLPMSVWSAPGLVDTSCARDRRVISKGTSQPRRGPQA